MGERADGQVVDARRGVGSGVLQAQPAGRLQFGAARDEAFFRVNALLLRNTSVVNMLDGCALSLPCHENGELPVGLMLWHGALRDDTILNCALQVERLLSPNSPDE